MARDIGASRLAGEGGLRTARATVPGIVALVLMIVVAYLPVRQAGYLWDDQDYVVGNTNLVRPDGLRRIWFEPHKTVQYYPLVHTALWLEYRLWQLRPQGYHQVNVLLHAVNAALLWMVLLRLAVPGAWFIAALFGLHPLQVESVAWITEIKNLLSGCFYLLSVWAYLRFQDARAGEAEVSRRPRERHDAAGALRGRRLYALSLGLFVLALLSKTTAVTLPAVLLVLMWWKSLALRRQDLLALVPMFGIAVVSGIGTWWLETYHVGSENVLVLSMWERLLLPARIALFYAAKLLLPFNLNFIYPRWSVDPGVWWQLVFPLVAAGLLVVLWRMRQRLGKGPLVAVLFFLLTLAPVSGVLRFYFQQFSFVGDHFQYFASIGLLALVVAPAARWARGNGSRTLQLVVTRGIPAVVLVSLAALTWSRAQVYRTEEALWQDTVTKNPTAWIAHNNLGVVFMRQGHKAEATAAFAEALKYNPNIPEAHANLGVLYQQQGDARHAIEEYRQAVAIKPSLADTQYDLAVLLTQSGEVEEAAQHLTTALTWRPKFAEAHMKMGDIYYSQGRQDQAVEKYRLALSLQPSLAGAHYRLGSVLASRNAFPEAREHLAEAVRLTPNDARSHALLGLVLENLGDKPGARTQYERARALNPQVELATEGLARLSAQE
jgi:Flp pilus assembly protein TadD